LYVVSAMLVLLMVLPAMSLAKRSGAEKGSFSADRGVNGQMYHQERVVERNQYRNQMHEQQGDMTSVEIPDQDRIRDQIRDHIHDPDQDQIGDKIRDRIRDPETHLPDSEI